MASESGRSVYGRLGTDRNGEMTLFISLVNAEASDETQSQSQIRTEVETESERSPDEIRVVIISSLNQSFIVLRSGSLFDALFKESQSPASTAAIEALPDVEVGGDNEEGVECAICLEEVVKVAKEMPCEHRFHGACVERWLRMQGTCPVCRFQMPVEEQSLRKGGEEDGNGGVRREIWIPVSVRSVETESETTEQETSYSGLD